MAMALYEDAPPDLLAGRMDLQVILPEGDQQKVSVPRSTAMMDLRVQLTTSRKLSPSAFSLQPLGPAGETLPFQPSTPVGALDVWSVRLIPKTRSNSSAPVKRAAPRPIPVAPGAPGAPTFVATAGGAATRTIVGGPGPPSFEQTFRLQVHLPRNQLFVTRASSRVLLGDVLQLACQEKNLDPAKYEIRHPANLEERLSLEATLGECNLTEVALVPCGARQPDTPALLRQEARRQEARRREAAAAHRGSGTGAGAQPTLSAHFPYVAVVPHSVGAEGSVSSMSSGGRSASPAPSDGSSVDRSTSPPQPLPPQSLPPQSLPPTATTKVLSGPNRPGRKRRPAPKPPGPPATELNNNVCNKEASAAPVISHSRNSSDSSGYHEASVLSESPEGGASCGGSGTESLPSLAPRGKNELSQSMTNLSMAQHAAAAPKTGLPPDGGGGTKGTPGKRRLYKMWTYLIGQRKKKAPPPPPPVAANAMTTSASTSSMPSSTSETFLKTQSLERRDMVRAKSSTLPAMGAASAAAATAPMTPPADDADTDAPSSAEPSSPEISLAPTTPSPCPPDVAEPPSQHARVASSSSSQTPTPTPSEGNSGSFGEEASSRHESMPYDASIASEYYEVIHEEAEMTSSLSKSVPDEKDGVSVTPPTPEDQDPPQTPPNAKATSPALTPLNKSVTSNDTVYLTPNCTKSESAFGTPGDKEEEWHYRLPSPPSAFRDARSDSPAASNARGSPIGAGADEVSSELTRASSHSDEEIERITGGGSVASDESPSLSPVERPVRASPGRVSPGLASTGRVSPGLASAGRVSPGRASLGRASPILSGGLSGTAAVLNELSQVISQQRKDRVQKASTLEHPKLSSVESRLENFSMSTYSRPQSAHSVISPEVKPSLVVARRSSFNNGNGVAGNGAGNGNGVSVRRTTSHATLSGLSAGQAAFASGKEPFRKEALRSRTMDKPLARATSEMNLNAGLPAPLELDPEQASLLDEFMEWRRQQRLKKQAQSNGDAGDVRAKVLEDDVQSLQMFQRILNHVEATEQVEPKCSSPPTFTKPPTPPPKPKEVLVEQPRVKTPPMKALPVKAPHVKAPSVDEAAVRPKEPTPPPVRPKETTPPPAVREASPSPVEEVVLRHKAETSPPSNRARHVVSGPPIIQMASWNERPKRQVSIKLDRDYWVGVGAAGLRRTDALPGLVEADKAQVETDAGRRATLPNSRPGPAVDPKPAPKPALDPKIVSSQKADPSRIPIVRAVELKRSASEQVVPQAVRPQAVAPAPVRPVANSVVYLSASDDSSVKAVSVSANKTKKFTSVVDISGPAVAPAAPSAPVPPAPVPPASVNGNSGSNGVRVNGVVPHGGEAAAKKKLPMPVVKPFKVKDNVMSRQLSAPNPTPPPPPPVPPMMPVLKKTPRPQSLPAKALDPRDQLLEAIRNFGGRTNLRPT